MDYYFLYFQENSFQIKSKRAQSCRSKNIPAGLSSRRRSLSTPDLHNKARVYPIVKQQYFAMNTIEETIDTPAPYMTEEECHAGYSDDNTSVDKTEKEESQSEQIIQNRCEEQKHFYYY